MRSRNGNYSFSLSICSIILCSSPALHAGEYLISYRYVVKNTILYNESLSISKAMKKCYGNPQTPILLETYGHTDIKDVIAKNSQEFIDYIHRLGLQVQNHDDISTHRTLLTTILTLKTTCFKVDFNDSLARIAPLK